MGFWDWFKTSDEWEPVFVIQGRWEINHVGSDTGDYITTDVAVFQYFYSKTLDKYKLETSGYLPLKHPRYPNAIAVLHQLNTKTVTIEQLIQEQREQNKNREANEINSPS